MSHVPHDLHDEFPGQAAALHELKEKNAHFQKLSERYSEVNHEIYKFEAQIAATADFTLEDLKKQRLHLLDEIAALLPHK